MTGWSTITFMTERYEEKDQIPNWRDYVDRHGTKWPREQLANELFTLTDSPRYITTRAGVVSGVIARWVGYRDWPADEAVLDEVTDLVTHAVVVQANDTTDTGQARLYQKTGDGFGVTDQYTETQDEGLHVGEKAASYMHATHDVPALAHTRQTRNLYRSRDQLQESDYF